MLPDTTEPTLRSEAFWLFSNIQTAGEDMLVHGRRLCASSTHLGDGNFCVRIYPRAEPVAAHDGRPSAAPSLYASLSGWLLTLQHAASRRRQVALTDRRGTAVFAGVQPGESYEIVAAKPSPWCGD